MRAHRFGYINIVMFVCRLLRVFFSLSLSLYLFTAGGPLKILDNQESLLVETLECLECLRLSDKDSLVESDTVYLALCPLNIVQVSIGMFFWKVNCFKEFFSRDQ